MPVLILLAPASEESHPDSPAPASVWQFPLCTASSVHTPGTPPALWPCFHLGLLLLQSLLADLIFQLLLPHRGAFQIHYNRQAGHHQGNTHNGHTVAPSIPFLSPGFSASSHTITSFKSLLPCYLLRFILIHLPVFFNSFIKFALKTRSYTSIAAKTPPITQKRRPPSFSR